MRTITQINDKNAIRDGAVMRHIMNRKLERGTFKFMCPPIVTGHYSVAGRNESEGPVGEFFDAILPDSLHGEETYEKAECSMLIDALDGAMQSCGLGDEDIDLLIGGDLLNQIVSTNYAARCFNIPFMGVYNACATSAEALTLGAMAIDSGYCERVACCTGSHFAAAERQYRGPLELGSQKAPYSQSTVTGSGCCILSNVGEGPRITEATIGRVIDYGIVDQTNMSAAMAPAARDTLLRHFQNTGTGPKDYDLIVSGDLGKLGEDILRELLAEDGIKLGNNYIDCGHMIYALNQKMQQGGSGAGCSMSVLTGFFLPKLENGEYKKILLVATGALLSPTSSQQGESIPSIAHAVVLEGIV